MKRIAFWLAALLCCLAPTAALAHPEIGASSGFAHGFMHPLSGIDHLLAMFMVGMVAYRMGGRVRWLLPMTFIGMMVVGGVVGAIGLPLSLAEVGIALSVIVLGLIVAFEVKLPVVMTFVVVGLFAIFHGHVHGSEMPAEVSGVAFGLGFVCATALLHAMGVGLSALTRLVQNSFLQRYYRLAGGLAALTGIVLLTAIPAARAEDSAASYVDGTSVVGLWEDETKTTIGETAEYTNSVELADINGDGRVDILFANGGDYEAPGKPEFSRIFLNQGAGQMFKEISKEVFGPEPMVAVRAIRVADVNNDGHADILVASSYQTQSRLYVGDGKGGFNNVTASQLPQIKASVGDAKFGDADGDGDLDLILADWGAGSPMKNEGGRTMLWLNDGKGHFTDATAERMPDAKVRFSWNLEFVDVDNDFDLDILVSSKKSPGGFLFENDGSGHFKDVSQGRMPQYTNNYDYEAMDLNHDGFLDLITMNDGEHLDDGPYARRDHIFINDGKGGFVDASPTLWKDNDNPAVDDNLAVMLDYDSDGDPDVLVASLAGPDRVLINDGTGHLHLHTDWVNSFTGDPTHGTLGTAIADLNGDGKLDVVQSQGEVPGSWDERVFLGKHIKRDEAPPVIALVESVRAGSDPVTVHARVHDNKSPTMPHDWKSVVLRWTADGNTQELPMHWYGEYLWRATVAKPQGSNPQYQICATDAEGNRSCSLPMTPKSL